MAETAGLVEALKLRFVVDVQPLDTQYSEVADERGDNTTTNPATLVTRGNDRVQEEGMRSPIPHRVDEAHEFSLVEGPDPGAAVTLQPLRPGNQERLVPEGVGVEAGEFPIVDGAANLDLHGETVLGVSLPCGMSTVAPETGSRLG